MITVSRDELIRIFNMWVEEHRWRVDEPIHHDEDEYAEVSADYFIKLANKIKEK